MRLDSEDFAFAGTDDNLGESWIFQSTKSKSSVLVPKELAATPEAAYAMLPWLFRYMDVAYETGTKDGTEEQQRKTRVLLGLEDAKIYDRL